jgi:hypothetical protein
MNALVEDRTSRQKAYQIVQTATENSLECAREKETGPRPAAVQRRASRSMQIFKNNVAMVSA